MAGPEAWAAQPEEQATVEMVPQEMQPHPMAGSVEMEGMWELLAWEVWEEVERSREPMEPMARPQIAAGMVALEEQDFPQ